MSRRLSLISLGVLVGVSIALFITGSVLQLGIVRGPLAVIGAVFTPVSYMFYSVVGALIVWRRGNNSVGWLFCGAGLGWALSWSAGVVVERGRFVGDRAADVVVWLSSWTEVLGITCLVLALLVFPTGRLASSRWRPVAVLTVVVGIVTALGEAFVAGPLEDYPYVDNPYPAGDLFGTFRAVGWALLMVPVAASGVSLISRFRRARAEERLQLKWMMFAGLLMVMYLAFWGYSVTLFGSDRIAETFVGIASLSVPAAAGIAILKYRLYDIDVVINRALVYGALTAVLAGAYVGLVFGFQAVLTPFAAESDLAIAASTLGVAALFRPVRSHLQDFIDRRFYRQKFDAERTVAEFSARLRDEVELNAVTSRLAGVVRDTMQPTHVSLWMRAGGGTVTESVTAPAESAL